LKNIKITSWLFYGKINEKNFANLLLLIACLGGLLRTAFAVFLPLESDEVYQLFVSKTPILQMLKATIDIHAPSWSLILHFLEVLSQNYVLIRFSAVILGLLSIILIGFLAKTIFNSKTALLSAAVFALSPTQIYYSANLRMYSLSIFIALLILFSFIIFLNSGGKKARLLLFLSFTLGNYTYYLFPVLPLSLSFFLLIKRKKLGNEFKKFISIFTLSLLATLPLFFAFLKAEPLPGVVLPEFSLQKILFIPISYTFAQNLALMLGSRILEINLVKLMLLGLSFVNIAILLSLFFKKLEKNDKFLIFMLVTPLSIVIVFSTLILPVLGLRSILIFSIPFYLLIGKALAKTIRLQLVYVILCLITVFATLVFFVRRPMDNLDFFLSKNVSSQQIILHTEMTTFLYFSYKFPQFRNEAAIDSLYTPQITKSILKFNPIDPVTLNNKSFWLIEVLSSPLHKNQVTQFKTNIERTHKNVFEKNFGDVQIYDFEAL